ncbi:MAG TPA: hypothetical protein VF014_10875, partial [Casimicrobiaceae bacterium]|nr:hypothetical protein [Casimicrobiaceae bacterium]
VEAQKRKNTLGRDRSSRGPRQQPQHEVGEENAEKNEKKGYRSRGQLSHQAAAEDHDGGKILTFSGLFADNAAGTA